MIGRSKRATFQGIIDKANSKIEGWKAKSLSQAGILVLIKVVAAVIPSYAMSTFMFYASICHKLDQMFKNFWQGFLLRKTGTSLLNLGVPSASLCLLGG
jgi:hypothetical protein